MQQWDTEDVETVAGVVRLLRRAAELSWTQADAGGPRSPHQLFALGIDAAADEAANLLPRRIRLDGPTPVGHSFWHRRSSCCVESAPANLHQRSTVSFSGAAFAGFRADLGGELRCRRVTGAP